MMLPFSRYKTKCQKDHLLHEAMMVLHSDPGCNTRCVETRVLALGRNTVLHMTLPHWVRHKCDVPHPQLIQSQGERCSAMVQQGDLMTVLKGIFCTCKVKHWPGERLRCQVWVYFSVIPKPSSEAGP